MLTPVPKNAEPADLRAGWGRAEAEDELEELMLAWSTTRDVHRVWAMIDAGEGLG